MSDQQFAERVPGSTAPYRVAQWATGNVGARSLRAVIEHPQLDLVGVLVHDPAKAGRDAGELCGTGPVGVTTTSDIGDIIRLKPDCVLYMPQGCDFDAVCRLLAAGVNIVTTRGEFLNPAHIDAAMRARVEAACHAGGASIHSTGSSPGFITEAVPLVLASIQRRLDCLIIDEFADVSSRDSPQMIFQIMGFGAPPSDFDERRIEYIKHSFAPSLHLVAEAVGLPLDEVVASGDMACARETTHIAAGTLEAGTVAATRIEVTGLRRGRALLRFRANWYCTADIDKDWNLRATGWRVQVEGDTPLDVEIRFPIPLERMAAVTPGYTAHRAVNAIAYVCAAAPGIRTSTDLPQIIPFLG
jgi:4-hydroxy-tetrahydrodipicolinate reductase